MTWKVIFYRFCLAWLLLAVPEIEPRTNSTYYPLEWNRSLGMNRTSLLTVGTNQKQELLSKSAFQGLVSFLLSNSPPHLTCFVFDNNFNYLDAAFTEYSITSTSYAVMQFPPDLSTLFDVLKIMLKHSTVERRHVIVLSSMKKIASIFSMVSRRNLESSAIWWIVAVFTIEEMDLLRASVREGSQVTVLLILEGNAVKVYSSRVDTNGMIIFKLCASWTQRNNVSKSRVFEQIFVDLQGLYSNFHGRKLIITANNSTTITIQGNGEMLPVSGFDSSIIQALSDTLNFTYRISPPADGKWGGPLPDGSVVGMIGVVYRREAHFALCELTITPVREEIIDFSYPYYTDILTLVSRTPREKSQAFAVFSPFANMVWAIVISSVLILGLVMSYNSWLLKDTSPADSSRQSLTEIFFSITESLITQESRLTPPYDAMRFTLLLWYIFYLILSALYSGMLTAVLVKPSFEKPVNSLSDLPYAVQNGFTLVVSADTSDYFLFKGATEGIYADTWKLFNQEDKAKSFPLNSDGSYDKILHDKQIFIRGEAAAIFITTRIGREQFHLAKETFSPQLYGMVFFTGAPFQATFNKMLSYMNEGGLIRKWRDDGFRKLKSKPTLTESSGQRAFTLSQLQAAFYVLLIGFLSAAVALILENLFSFFNKFV